MSLALRYAARSDRGLVRTNNEDSVYAGARLLALADGMGGHAAGEVASQLVIAALAPLDDDEPGGDLLTKLDEAIHEGNSAIAGYVEDHPELEGMGTTLTAVLFAGNRIGLAHIGDSRGYLLRDGELIQITKDDTFVQTLVDEGRITPEEAHSHPQRSLIMRALTGHEVEPTLTMRETHAGDRYLLCSDGLSDPVSTETIKEALEIPDVDDSAHRLVELALRGGGPDNVTVVVADVVDVDYGQTQPILAGALCADDEATTVIPNTAAGRASAFRPHKNVVKRVLPQIENLTHPPSSKPRMLLGAILVGLLLLSALLVGRAIIRTNYYVAEYHGTVSILRGVQGSILGFPLQEPYLLACLNQRGELLEISYDQPPESRDCRALTLADLRAPARQQVSNGLPASGLDGAIHQLRNLARESLLPPCTTGERGGDSAKGPGEKGSTPPSGSGSAGDRKKPGTPHLPTLTSLPAPPPNPGTDCRMVP